MVKILTLLLMTTFLPFSILSAEPGKFDLNEMSNNENGQKLLSSYAEAYVKSLLYKSEVECVHYKSTSNTCGELPIYKYEYPLFIKLKNPGVAVVFSKNKDKLPFAIVIPDDKGYFYVEEGGVFVGSEEHYIKLLKEEY